MNAGRNETFFQMFDGLPGERACVILPDGSAIRYNAMAARSRAIAAGLAALGVRRGDAVALWMANRPEWLQSFLACARLGALVVAVNPRLRSRDLGALLRCSLARVLVTDALQGPACSDVILRAVAPGDLTSLRAIIVVGACDPIAWRPFDAVSLDVLVDDYVNVDVGRPEDPCVLFTTSGTTAAPKLVVHRQASVVAHARDVAASFELTRPDTAMLQLVPLCGVFGFTQAMAALAAAAPSVMPQTFNAGEAARLARAHRITNMVGTNDMLHAMLATADDDPSFPHLRFFGHANFNPTLTDLPAQAEARGIKLRGLFGMSETFALFAAQPADADLERRQLSGGVPVSSSGEARVRDLESGQLAPVGAHGEIELCGPSLMSGYLSDREATRAAFTSDGFLRTGDLGYATEDGGFIHLGRIADVLRLGGFLVHPLEIEETILEIDGLRACQVVEARLNGQPRPVAFVVATAGMRTDAAAIVDHCRRRIASFKVPALVIVLDSLPTVEGSNGVKIRRDELRRMAQAALDAGAA
jgi:fatty-acyl-CoA synthase